MILELIFPLWYHTFLAPILPPEHIPEEKTVHITTDSILCSCVSFVRQWRPDIPLMDASRFVPATTTPSLGAVAVMYYPNSGMSHLAIVIAVDGDTITVRDANYRPCRETVRTITLPDRVVGYL